MVCTYMFEHKKFYPLQFIVCCSLYVGSHYTWTKVVTTIHNIIIGNMWIDQVCIIGKCMGEGGDKNEKRVGGETLCFF